MPGLLKQVGRKGHRLCPLGVFKIGLLGESREIEIGVKPKIVRSDFLANYGLNALRDVS